MEDVNETDRSTEEVVRSMPEPPSIRQLREAEMERNAALASARRSEEKVTQLREDIEHTRARSSKEKASLLKRAINAEAETERVRKRLENLRTDVEREAPLLDVLRKHYDTDKAVPKCVCLVCRMHRKISDIRKETAEWKKRARELKDDLKRFQGPPSKKRKKIK